MREILFRGKREDNGEWVCGYYCHCVYAMNGGKTYPAIQQTDDGSLYFREIIPETIGQYTGLTDKNGKKIFEGDIVKDEQAKMLGKVVYATAAAAAEDFDGIAGFMVDNADVYDGLQNYNGFWHLCEVIGNIYDNPELLGGDVGG